jgi:hypothetical protein
MELRLFTTVDETLQNAEDPIGLSVSFDDGLKFMTDHIFENDGVGLTWIYKDETGGTPGIFISKDSVKLLHATLGAYLGK